MSKKKNKRRTLPGGLSVEKFETKCLPPIYRSLLSGRISTFTMKQQAEEIINSLWKPASKLDEFLVQQTHYCCFTFAYELLKCEEIKCEVKIGRIICTGNDNTCFLTVTPDFWEKADPFKKMNLILKPVVKGCGSEIGCMVLRFSKDKRLLVVELDCDNKRVQMLRDFRYEVFKTPCDFNFVSQFHTLELLLDDRYVYPRLAENEVKIKQYLEDEKFMALDFIQPLNDLQKRSVKGILLRSSPYIPYILFGPPGTGKTTTLIEAIIQLIRFNKSNKILVCTPSNTAADHLTKTLMKFKEIDEASIFRLYSLSYNVENVCKEFEDITCMVDGPEPCMGIPPIDEFHFKVVICTLSSSSYLVAGGMRGMFSHIIVDEAGQAQELETLIPIIGLADVDTRLVLAGDPMQLGPVEAVNFLKKFNLNRSMLERFIKMKIYMNEDRRFMCMLKNNYRSHEALLELPSKLFYKNMLIASMPVKERNSLCNWKRLCKKGFPMFWHSVCEDDEKEFDGFSYRNKIEADIVCTYVNHLLSETDVKPEEIGVVTPYKYQAKTIRALLMNNEKIVVDSVERFQGSERRVIIVSLVRSAEMGFLNCAKRLNTTITRAKELLIITGNHNNLKKNRNWKSLIQHCENNNALSIEAIRKKKIVLMEQKLTDIVRDDELLLTNRPSSVEAATHTLSSKMSNALTSSSSICNNKSILGDVEQSDVVTCVTRLMQEMSVNDEIANNLTRSGDDELSEDDSACEANNEFLEQIQSIMIEN